MPIPVPRPAPPTWSDGLAQTLEDTAQSGGGWLGFDQFMAIALGHPTEGYYSRAQAESGTSPIGSAGDFMTAPMLGPWLADCLARRFMGLAQASSQPLSIREYGPGTGQLALDLLTTLEAQGALPERYELMETSAGLAALQQAQLRRRLSSEAYGRLHWTMRQGGEAALAGLVIANEVADALPVQVFEWQSETQVLEWGLRAAHGSWGWTSRPAAAPLLARVQARAQAVAPELGGWQPGHRGEWSPWLAGWAQSLARGLRWGELVIIDYGFEAHELDHPDRSGGTLAAHRAHRRIDDWAELIQDPGGQDLTAHVDFTEMAESLLALGGLELTLKTQAAWLLDQGLLEIAQQRLFPDPADRGRPPADPAKLRALADLQTLLSDGAMGQRFLVLSARRD